MTSNLTVDYQSGCLPMMTSLLPDGPWRQPASRGVEPCVARTLGHWSLTGTSRSAARRLVLAHKHHGEDLLVLAAQRDNLNPTRAACADCFERHRDNVKRPTSVRSMHA